MTKVQIVGRKPHVEPVLGRLYGMGLLELASAHEEPALELAPFPGEAERAERVAELRLLLAQLDGLLALAGDSAATIPARRGCGRGRRQRASWATLTPLVEPLADRIEELRTELAVLPRYIEPLRRLLPLVPELAELDESEIRALQLDAVALVLNTDDEAVVDALREALRTELGDRFVLVAARVDADAIGCVIVTPHSAAEGVQALLGRERVRPMPLPSRYENLSFQGAVDRDGGRLREIPGRARPGAERAARAARAARGGVEGGARAAPGRHRAARSGGAGRGDESRVRRRRLDTRANACPSCASSSNGPPAASSCSRSSRRRPTPSRRC